MTFKLGTRLRKVPARNAASSPSRPGIVVYPDDPNLG
jgi:hypothetical protein